MLSVLLGESKQKAIWIRIFTQRHMYSMYVNVCTTHMCKNTLLKQVQMHFKEQGCVHV